MKRAGLFFCCVLMSIANAAEIYLSVDDDISPNAQGKIYVYDTLLNTTTLFTTMPSQTPSSYLAVTGTTGVVTNDFFNFSSSVTISSMIYTFNTQNPGVPPTPLTGFTGELGRVITGLALSDVTNKGYGIYVYKDSPNLSNVIFEFSPTSTLSPVDLLVEPMPRNEFIAIAVAGTKGYVVVIEPSFTTPTASDFRSAVYSFDLTMPSSFTPFTTPVNDFIASIAISGTLGCLLALPPGSGLASSNIYTFDLIQDSVPTLLTTATTNKTLCQGISLISATLGYITGWEGQTGGFQLLEFNPQSMAEPVLVSTLMPPSPGFAIANSVSSGPTPPPPPSPSPSPIIAQNRYGASSLAYAVNTAFEAQFNVLKSFMGHLSQQRLERSFTTRSQELTAARGKKIDYCTCPPKDTFSFWGDGFAAYFHQKPTHQAVPFSSVLGGMILGFDYKGRLDAPLGGGIGFTHSGVDENSLGHARVEEEYVFLYESFVLSHFYVDLALWGSYAQIRNVRNSGLISATSQTTAWFLTPHLELGGDITGRGWKIEPFAALDWPNSWEQGFREHAAGNENLVQKKQHASLLRTEAGLRFYENVPYGWGRLVFLEKVSYVNKQPFHVGAVKASFLSGAPGLITVDVLSSTENLGVGELGILFEPKKKKYPYASLSYQGEFGSTFQSHQGTIDLGWNL